MDELFVCSGSPDRVVLHALNRLVGTRSAHLRNAGKLENKKIKKDEVQRKRNKNKQKLTLEEIRNIHINISKGAQMIFVDSSLTKFEQYRLEERVRKYWNQSEFFFKMVRDKLSN